MCNLHLDVALVNFHVYEKAKEFMNKIQKCMNFVKNIKILYHKKYIFQNMVVYLCSIN